MRFGPAPAPAHMQSYVARTFGELRSPSTGEEFCAPLMDDLTISSRTFAAHIEDLTCLRCKAEKNGFELKLAKAQFNQEEFRPTGDAQKNGTVGEVAGA